MPGQRVGHAPAAGDEECRQALDSEAAEASASETQMWGWTAPAQIPGEPLTSRVTVGRFFISALVSLFLK